VNDAEKTHKLILPQVLKDLEKTLDELEGQEQAARRRLKRRQREQWK
jgi:hypothetical protein